METRTVHVEGLPIEIPLERLKDKLTIYFLRPRNGGGEIENIDIVLESPAYALVTFEEADVAQRVLKMKGHTLLVSGKPYPLKVTAQSTELSPDEIFSRVSMIVDYRRFPDSIKHSVKSLREIHKHVQFSFDQTEELFTVNGKYTNIQAFSNDVIKILGLENNNLKEHLSPQRNIEMDDASKFRVTRNLGEISNPLVESKFETWNQKSKAEKQNPVSEAEKGNPRSKPETQNLRVLEDNGLKAKYGNPEHEQDIEQLEDFSLVMDSDIYIYIQKFHHAEFQNILCKHEVEVVDVSSDGITTLYLQAGFERGNHIGTLTKALYDLLHMYRQFEASLRKEQISKMDLKYDSRSLQRMPEEIHKLCPSLLCLEDEMYFYLIGNVIDLSQAKRCIQGLMSPKEMGKLIKPSELLLGSDTATRQRTTSSGSSKEYETDILLKKSGPTKFELKEEHKLAANFSHPKAEMSLVKPTSLVDKMDNMCQSSIWSREGDHQKTEEALLSTQLNKEHPIQDIETGVLSGAGTGTGENGQKDPQMINRMKGNISRKTPETSPSFIMNKSTSILHSIGTRKSLGPMKPYSHGNALQYLSLHDTHGTSNFLDSEYSKPKISIRRSNSFSAGRLKEANPPYPEVNFKEHRKVPKDIEILDEICLYTWLWSYMKDIPNITEQCNGNGIQIAEENTQDITILKIRADSKTKLELIKDYLQSLYQRLSTELTYQTFSYYELGFEGPHDEALSEWCSLLSHCDKLRLKKLEHSVHLTYPKDAQSSITEKHTKFITSRSKALKHSSQLYATDKHMSRQYQSEKVYISDSQSAPYGLSVSEHQTHLGREEAIGEMNSDPQRTSESLHDFQGMEGEEDSSGPKELLVLSSDDVKYNIVTESDARLGQAKVFQEGSISEKETLTHPRDLMRLENDGMETDVSKVKKTLPDKFQFLKIKSKGGLPDEIGTQRFGICPWDGIPHSLPTGLYNTQQNYAGLKTNEQSAFISKLSSGGQMNLDKYFFPNQGPQEESAAKPQLKHPTIGQETVGKKARNCDQCKKGETETATIQCGHSFCRTCFSASENACTACLRSFPVGTQHTIKGTMTHRTLSSSVMGYYQDPTLKIIYDMPDGVQGPSDPKPGSSYTGGRFEAFLPDNKEGRKLLTLLERALDQGLTFKIQSHPSGSTLTWNILHKTSEKGGILKKGYPDSQYLGNVFRQLKEYGIE